MLVYPDVPRMFPAQAFKDMVSRCKKVNVDIYVDAVINHVAAGWESYTFLRVDGPEQ